MGGIIISNLLAYIKSWIKEIALAVLSVFHPFYLRRHI